MDFLDIPGLNIAQESGGMGWNPANGVPFCARAYICRPRPLGPLGAILKEGGMSDALSTIRCGWRPPSQPMRSEKTYPSGTLPNQHSVLPSSSRTSAAQRREIRVASAPRAAKACYFGSPSRAKNAGAAHNKAAALVAEIGSSRRRS